VGPAPAASSFESPNTRAQDRVLLATGFNLALEKRRWKSQYRGSIKMRTLIKLETGTLRCLPPPPLPLSAPAVTVLARTVHCFGTPCLTHATSAHPALTHATSAHTALTHATSAHTASARTALVWWRGAVAMWGSTPHPVLLRFPVAVILWWCGGVVGAGWGWTQGAARGALAAHMACTT